MEINKNKKLTYFNINKMIEELENSRKKNIIIKKDDLIYLFKDLKKYKLVEYIAENIHF